MNIVVTGAASGIGRRLVTLLAERGHAVIAADVDAAGLERSAADCGWTPASVEAVPHDVTSADDWASLVALAVERFERVDALVNVAGVLRVESVAALKPQSVALQLDVNTKGVILGTHAAATAMIRQQGGHIINVASMAALAPIAGISVYSASKFAVRGFSLAAAQELEPHGVRVSVVCPDAVDTPMVDYQVDHAGAAMTFSGPRILTADEVARAIIGLLARPRLELAIPWSRGLVARSSTLLPRWLHRWITGRLTKKGLARQKEIRDRRGETR